MNKNSRTLRRKFFQKKIPIYRKNPVLFAQEVLLFEPDDWQKQALMDLAESPKVAIKSGQGVGKTGMEAVALLWFLCCYPYPRIVATAPTKQQLHDVLWSEVSKWMSKSPLLSDILRGKMLLESKEEMKKRGIDSPDRADAVALSCYQKKTFNIGSLVD